MKYGLSAETLTSMKAVFLKYPKIEKVILYGSRAKGNYHEGSDIDLTLLGDKLDLQCLYAIDEELDMLDLPYTIDLSLYGQISNEGLIEHIERRGEVFYKKVKGWEVIKLGEACNIIGGGTPSKAIENYYLGNIPWATVRDMNNDLLINTQFKISQEAVKCSSTNIISKDNIVIATRVGLGKVCCLNQDTAINQDLKAIIPKNDQLLLKHFLFWWLKSIAHTIELAGTGATVKGVKLPFVKNLDIPIPSINKQKRLVLILDQVFADIEKARANAEQNLKNARELFESYLQQVFSQRGDGWENNQLEKLSSLITKGSSPKWQGINYVESPGVLFVTSENVGANKMLYKKTKFVEETFNDKNRKSILNEGDVLTNIVGASIGRTAIFDKNDNANINQAVCLIRCDFSLLNNEYLTYLLNSPYLIQILHDNEVNNARANLSLTFFRKLDIPTPSLQEQGEIVSRLKLIESEVNQLKSIYQNKLEVLDELKKSILQKAFTGELTKKDVV